MDTWTSVQPLELLYCIVKLKLHAQLDLSRSILSPILCPRIPSFNPSNPRSAYHSSKVDRGTISFPYSLCNILGYNSAHQSKREQNSNGLLSEMDFFIPGFVSLTKWFLSQEQCTTNYVTTFDIFMMLSRTDGNFFNIIIKTVVIKLHL